uniref:Protein kinase domain-containing protein n=1 Tax=Panagrellus redivivus TaxID=6233 RepID=A0A7E4VNA4_PANRE
MSGEVSPRSPRAVNDPEKFHFPSRYHQIEEIQQISPRSRKFIGNDSKTDMRICIQQRSMLDTKDFANFVRELELCVKLHHKNISLILNLFLIPTYVDNFYIVYEHYEHDLSYIVTYRGWIDYKGGFTGAQRFSFIAYQLFCALRYLHRANIVHRDIRAQSVLLNSRCRVKIAYLSKARHTSEESFLNDDPGNDYYLAPEIWQKCEEIKKKWQQSKHRLEEFKPRLLPDTSWDIWAIGIVLHEVAQGKFMFTREQLDNARDKTELIKDFTQVVPSQIELQTGLGTESGKLKRENGVELLRGLLQPDTSRRLTAETALELPYVKWKPLDGDKTTPPAHCITVGVDKVKISTAEWRSNLSKMISDYNKIHDVDTWVPKIPEDVSLSADRQLKRPLANP